MDETLRKNEPIFTPRDFLEYLASVRKVDVRTFKLPSKMVMAYHRRRFNFLDKLIDGKPVDWWWYSDRLSMSIGSFNGVGIAVATNFIGSPAAAMVFEELIACGVRKVVEVGIAGGIQPFLKPGDIIVATETVCDEGTTCHYLRRPRNLTPSPSLKRSLVGALNRNSTPHLIGSVLTTDGVYRETWGKIEGFRKTGVLAVDMESSALYAVAQHRGVEIASGLIVSDLLTERGWRPAFGNRRVLKNTETLLKLALEAVSKA